jgi:hypothetical protein
MSRDIPDAVMTSGWVAAGMAFMAGIWFLWSNAFTAPQLGIIALAEIALFTGAALTIRRGKALRAQIPCEAESDDGSTRAFYVVFAIEFVLILVLDIFSLNVLHRVDLVPFFTSLVVGAHFIPLARIFRTPSHAVFGSAIVAWCVICWFAFPTQIGIATCIGTGVVLWGLSLSLLLRGRRDARSVEVHV